MAMGVYRTDYLMWATDVGMEAFSWEKHENELDGAPDRRFDIVRDGMSGQYCFAGKIIASSNQYEGFGVVKINPNDLVVNQDEIANIVAAAFGIPEMSAADFSLIMFSHHA